MIIRVSIKEVLIVQDIIRIDLMKTISIERALIESDTTLMILVEIDSIVMAYIAIQALSLLLMDMTLRALIRKASIEIKIASIPKN